MKSRLRIVNVLLILQRYFDCMGHLSVNGMAKTEDRLGKQITTKTTEKPMKG
jgi:hypothetical protein